MEAGSLAAWVSVSLTCVGLLYKAIKTVIDQALRQRQESPGSMKKIQEYVVLADKLRERPDRKRQLQQVDALLEWELDRYTIGEAVQIQVDSKVYRTGAAWDIATIVLGTATPVLLWVAEPRLSWIGWVTTMLVLLMMVGPYVLPHFYPQHKKDEMKARSQNLESLSKRGSWQIK